MSAVGNFCGVVVVATLSVSAACSSAINRASVVGKYIANHGKAFDAIDLNQDGTYTYLYRPKSGAEFHNSGRWTLYREGSEARITFRDFIFGLPGYGGGPPGYWDVEVETSWAGKLRLSINPDLNYYYVKQ